MNNQNSITYNHLNLPTLVEWTDGRSIEWIYDAVGTKLRKIVRDTDANNNTIITVKDYLGNVEYTNNELEAIYHTEGRITPTGNPTQPWQYEYTIKDHLGNGRVWWTWNENNNQPEVLQTADYYPFGMQHAEPNATQIGLVNNYKYNGKELDSDFGLNWYHYGFRIYDSQIGRFPSIDPKANEFPHVSTYNYAENEPVGSIDLWGLQRLKINGSEINKHVSGAQIAQTTAGAKLRHFSVTPRQSNIADRTAKELSTKGLAGKDIGLLGGDASERNAFKHTLGSALFSKEFGAETTLDITNAHEGIGKNDDYEIDFSKPFIGDKEAADQVTDLLNNPIGIELGTGNEGDNKDIASQVLDEFTLNGLWVATGDKEGSFIIQKVKISEDQANKLKGVLDQLNQHGSPKGSDEEPRPMSW